MAFSQWTHGYWEGEEDIGLTTILALVVRIIFFVVIISVILIGLSPLDFTGELKNQMPTILMIIVLMIILIIILIVFVFIPRIITREE